MWQLPELQADEILIYLRKSRSDDPLLSVGEVLAKHEQMLNDWVARNLPAIDAVPESSRYREVVSGETLDSRPKMLEVLHQIESPKYKALLVVEPQRLSRGDLEDIGRLVKLLRYTNTIVITLQYTYDLRDERDRDLFERELKRGNEFLEYQKRIMNNGRLLAVQNGNYLGTKPPYGYKKIQIKEGKRTCYTLEPIPEQALVVRLIFELYAEGYGSHKIARHLNDLGYKTQRGNRWGAESLMRIRTNEHYLGKVVWNRRRTVNLVEDGEIIATRPRSTDYLVYPGKHEAIIDQELWDKVQEIRSKIQPIAIKAKYANPFAGLVHCQCGYSMTRRTYKNKTKNKRADDRLLCTNQATCGNASCTTDEMLEAVAQILREAIADFELKLSQSQDDRAAMHQELIAQREKRLEELTKLEANQWEKYTLEGMPKHIFEQLNAKVLAEKDEVQQAINTLRESQPDPVSYEHSRVMFSDALRLLLDPEAPVRKKNLLLKQCIEKIVYTRARKGGGNRRWGDPEPMELDVHLRV